MAEESTYFLNQVPIIGPEFCSPNPIDLLMVRGGLLSKTKFVVTDTNGNLVFKVLRPPLTLHDTHIIVDSSGTPILTLRSKMFSAHSRCEVFKGESSDMKDLVFTTKTSSFFQNHTNLDIFLPNNNSEEKVCDFKLKGGSMSRSFVIYAGETTTIVAQMDKKLKWIGKSEFRVKVQQNIDYAFIVALTTINENITTASAQQQQNQQHQHQQQMLHQQMLHQQML